METEVGTLKFKSGPLKGQRLETIGMSFEIISDDRVRFKNGTTAVFYRDDSPVVIEQYICPECRVKGITWYGACPHARPWPADLQPVHSSNPEVPKTFIYPAGPGMPGTFQMEPQEMTFDSRTHELRPVEPTFEPVYEQPTRKIKMRGYAITLGAFRDAAGERLLHPCDAAYAVIERGQQKYTVARQVAGTGWRELSWIYSTLRSVGGRNIVTALFEAVEIYFL